MGKVSLNAAPFRADSVLLRQLSDKAHQLGDLFLAQLSFVGGHLIFAFGDNLRQLGVAQFLNIFGMQVRNLKRLPHRRLARRIGSMAHRAFGLEEAFSRFLCPSCRSGEQNQPQYPNTQHQLLPAISDHSGPQS